MERLGNDFATTLASAITTAEQATFNVASSTGAPAVSFRVRIDDELMLITAVSHPSWTATRGIEGTTPTTHLNGADVVHVVTFEGLENYGLENFASQFPGAASGNARLVPASHQMNVVEELVVDGELDVEGEVNVI